MGLHARRLGACCVVLILLGAPGFSQTSTPVPSAQSTVPQFFPYKVETRTLANGLTIVVIPTPEFKEMVTYATVVFAGSGKETEKGKTGLAHLFEHIMFRHEWDGKPGGYEDVIRRMGAYNNAWTDYDLTFYHPTTFSENLVGPLQRGRGTLPGL